MHTQPWSKHSAGPKYFTCLLSLLPPENWYKASLGMCVNIHKSISNNKTFYGNLIYLISQQMWVFFFSSFLQSRLQKFDDVSSCSQASFSWKNLLICDSPSLNGTFCESTKRRLPAQWKNHDVIEERDFTTYTHYPANKTLLILCYAMKLHSFREAVWLPC